MLPRFSLYGFLKNQQYYEPFLVLAFLQMGLNFTLIGTLVAFREVMVNLMEIPTGALADLYGRRRCMIFCFSAYIASFATFGGAGLAAAHGHIGLSVLLPLLFLAMLFFAAGDAFRTGTHKAMIFTWLRLVGREAERTMVYGYTRSWSKVGSAVSVLVAGAFVFFTRDYLAVFFLCIVPYVLNIVNIWGYPAEVDGDLKPDTSIREVMSHLWQALSNAVRKPGLRRLMFESMGFEGFFKACKDYLQPILKNAALPLSAALFAGLALSEEQSAVVLIAPVYFVLYLLSAVASRQAHVLVEHHGQEARTARTLWLANFLVLAALVPTMYFGYSVAVIFGFIVLSVLQNLWRPVLISRFDTHGDEASGATILSIESQAQSAAVAVLAPLLGYLVDVVKSHEIGLSPFWPAVGVGMVLSALFFLTARDEGPTEKG
jgi:MFS family permease